MIDILGTQYISDKEAAARYGYSQQWFRLGRCKHYGPKYVKLLGKGKVYYPLNQTDLWFKENMQLI